MIYGFVQQSGGEVRIESEVRHGTKVSIYLPRHVGGPGVDTPSPRLDNAPHAERCQSVLVIDDEPAVRMLIAEVLRELGYDAIEAIDGPSGLARRQPISIAYACHATVAAKDYIFTAYPKR